MVPFDPYALLAILQAFYPVPTIANLRLARAERPEYFAGGELFGSCGEKLRLPDGRVWDLMFDCGGPSARWQAIEPGPGDGGGGDGFGLDPGPLAVLEVPNLLPPTPAQDFQQIVAGALLELGAPDDALQLAGNALGASTASGGLGDALTRDLNDAAAARVSQDRALDVVRPDELLEASQGAGSAIDGEAAEYPEPGDAAPPEIPPEDPGPPPPDDQRPPEA